MADGRPSAYADLLAALLAVRPDPATARFDKTMSLREEAPGAYAGPIVLDDGAWDVVLRVGRGPDGQPYTETLRFWVGARS